MPYAVPLSKKTNHPVMVGITNNQRMGRWDVTVDVGNFASEHDAMDAAKGIRMVLEEHLGVILRQADAATLEVKDN